MDTTSDALNKRRRDAFVEQATFNEMSKFNDFVLSGNATACDVQNYLSKMSRFCTTMCT